MPAGKLNNPGNTVAVSAEARSFLIRADPIDAFFKRRVRRNGQFLRDELSKTHRPGYGGVQTDGPPRDSRQTTKAGASR